MVYLFLLAVIVGSLWVIYITNKPEIITDEELIRRYQEKLIQRGKK